MKKSWIYCALASVALTACQTAGTGSGNVRGTQKPVAFTWQSTDSVSGNITATFGSGRVFKGTYFQITQDTRVDHLDPLWDGWGRPYRRGDWRYWTRNPGPEFVKTYSGRVLANLHDETELAIPEQPRFQAVPTTPASPYPPYQSPAISGQRHARAPRQVQVQQPLDSPPEPPSNSDAESHDETDCANVALLLKSPEPDDTSNWAFAAPAPREAKSVLIVPRRKLPDNFSDNRKSPRSANTRQPNLRA